jgi:hypothetical protein
VRTRVALERIVLLAFGLGFALVIGEVSLRLLRVVRPPAVSRGVERSLLWSLPFASTDRTGAVVFAAHSRIRELAIYETTIEYDMTYTTNNMGAADTVDYPFREKKRSFLIVGDSFTAGSGGYPLAPRLRALVPGANLYVFGMPGASVEHFRRVVLSVTRQLHIDDVVIVAISDDFQRPYWTPQWTNEFVCFRIGPGDACDALHAIAGVVPYDVDKSGALAAAQQYAAARREGVLRAAAESKQNRDWRLSSLLYLRLQRGWNRLNTVRTVNRAIRDMAELSRVVPGTRVHVIQLPQVDEVERKAYHIDLRPRLGDGADYFSALDRCSFSRELYHARDSHPNRAGYEVLAQCLAGYLRSQ